MKPVILGIDGRSGSGKSEMAKALAARFVAADSARTVSVFAVDQLYRGWNGLRAGIEVYAQEVVPDLAAGRSTTFQPWDWTQNTPEGQLGAPQTFQPTDLIIVEGFGAGAKAARPHLSALIWLNAPEAQRRSRALARGRAINGNYEDHWERWAADEQAFTDHDRVESAAHLVLETTGPPEAVQDAAFTMIRYEVSEASQER